MRVHVTGWVQMRRTTFTEDKFAYLRTQRLGRIATVDARGAPRVVPTGFRFNPETGRIDCGGHNLAAAECGALAWVVSRSQATR